MDNAQSIGLVVGALISLLTLAKGIDYFKSKDMAMIEKAITESNNLTREQLKETQKATKETQKATQQNTEQLIQLNEHFRHTLKRDDERDLLMSKSVEKLEALDKRVDIHGFEINRIKDKVFIKDRKDL